MVLTIVHALCVMIKQPGGSIPAQVGKGGLVIEEVCSLHAFNRSYNALSYRRTYIASFCENLWTGAHLDNR